MVALSYGTRTMASHYTCIADDVTATMGVDIMLYDVFSAIKL